MIKSAAKFHEYIPYCLGVMSQALHGFLGKGSSLKTELARAVFLL